VDVDSGARIHAIAQAGPTNSDGAPAMRCTHMQRIGTGRTSQQCWSRSRAVLCSGLNRRSEAAAPLRREVRRRRSDTYSLSGVSV
jgi:hypothetical protein